MPSIIYDFAGIRPRTDDAPQGDLAELIAEEQRVREPGIQAREKADLLLFAWRDANPGLDEKGAPAPIAGLYAEAEIAEEAADAHLDRILGWIPDNLADAIRLLELGYVRDLDSHVPENVLAGLRIIAGAPAADAASAAEPVTGDRRICELFCEWQAAWRYSDSIGKTATDEEMDEATSKASRFEDAIAETAAEGIAGLAVKLFVDYHQQDPCARAGDPCALSGNADLAERSGLALSAIKDIARLVPELAPLCAPALAENEEKQT
jgi:hypothetical protein